MQEEPPPPSRLRGAVVGVGLGVLVLALGIGGAWQLGFLGSRVVTTTRPPLPIAQAAPMLLHARELTLRADRHSYEEARDEVTRVLVIEPHNITALAIRAEIHAAWAELLRQRAADVDARSGMPGVDAPALRAEAALMRRDADERAERARGDEQTVLAALARVPAAERPGIEAMLADVSRVLNDRNSARQHIDAARGATDADLYGALLDRDEGLPARAVTGLQAVVAREGDNARARIALARIAMIQNDPSMARLQLDAVGRTYAAHEDATALADALARNEPPMRSDGHVVALNTPTPAPNPTEPPTHGVLPSAPVPPVPSVAPQVPTSPPTPNTNNGSNGSAAGGGSYDSLVTEGERFQNDGRTQQARERFQRALAMRPSGAEALTGMGYSDLDMHNYASAISRFRQALSSNGNYSEALIGLGEAYSSRGEYSQALRAYNQYLEINPGGSHASMARRQIESLQDRLQNDAPPGPTRSTPSPESPNRGDPPSSQLTPNSPPSA